MYTCTHTFTWLTQYCYRYAYFRQSCVIPCAHCDPIHTRRGKAVLLCLGRDEANILKQWSGITKAPHIDSWELAPLNKYHHRQLVQYRQMVLTLDCESVKVTGSSGRIDSGKSMDNPPAARSGQGAVWGSRKSTLMFSSSHLSPGILRYLRQMWNSSS